MSSNSKRTHKPDLRIKLNQLYNGKEAGHVGMYSFAIADLLIEQNMGEMTEEGLSPEKLPTWTGARPGDEEVARREAAYESATAENAKLRAELEELKGKPAASTEPRQAVRKPNKDNAASEAELATK